MKKILVFTVEKGNHPTLGRLSIELVNGFKQNGRDVITARLSSIEEVQNAYDFMQQGEVDFCVSFNNMVSDMKNDKGEYIFEELDIPYVSVLLDAPYNVTIGNINFPCNKHILCLLDRTHIDLIPRLFPNKKILGSIFMPLSGITNLSREEIFTKKRDYDVVCSASLYCDGDPGRTWYNFTNNKYILSILDDIADYLLSNTVSVADGFKYVLYKRGFLDNKFEDKLLPFYFLMFYYIKAVRRVRSVEALVRNNIYVDIFAEGWENVPFVKGFLGKYVKIHGRTSYEQTLDIISRSKIVYQDQAEFNNGGHDRVFSSMLNGAVVVSEYSKYLAEEFIDGKDIFLYDWKNILSQIEVIHKLLNNENERLSVVTSAYGKADLNHRWCNRAERICEAVELLR